MEGTQNMMVLRGGLLIFQHLMDHMARSEVSGDGDELNTVLQQSAMK